MKIKRFSSTSSLQIENEINEFLKQNPNINIIDKTQPIPINGFIFIFIYYKYKKVK